jgi:hypothetical protein
VPLPIGHRRDARKSSRPCKAAEGCPIPANPKGKQAPQKPSARAGRRLNHDGGATESRDEPVPFKEAPGLGSGAVLGFGEQAAALDDPRKEVVIDRRVRRIEPGRKDDQGAPSSVDRAFVRRSIDSNGSTRDDDEAEQSRLTPKRVRKVERFVIGPTRPDDRDRA